MRILTKLAGWLRRGRTRGVKHVNIDLARREFLKRAITASLLAGATAIGIEAFAQAPTYVNPKVILTQTSLAAPFVLIRRDGDRAIAIDGTSRREIMKSTDHAAVLQKVIDEYDQALVFIDCQLVLESDVMLKGTRYLWFIGSNFEGPSYSTYKTAIIFRNGARLIDDGVNWGFYKFSNIEIQVSGEYSFSPISLPKTLLFLENTKVANYASLPNNKSFMVLGSGGPPGKPVYWRNVKLIESRNAGQYGYFAYVWYEGFEIDGASVIFNWSVNVGWVRFIRVLGNAQAAFRNIIVFVGNVPEKTAIQFYIVSDQDVVIDGVEFPETILAPGNDGWSIIRLEDGVSNVTIISAFKNEAGSPIVPKIAYENPHNPNAKIVARFVGAMYRRSGIAALSGDGTTTDFFIGKHGLPFLIIDPSKVIVKVTPVSPDAIASSPCVGYLSDEDGDGIYESVRVKFASAPPAGTNNVKVVWEVEYV